MAYNFTAIESKWQKLWQEHKPFAALEPAAAGKMPKVYLLDMFPYPSGDGLHVGHGIQKVATDAVARFLRMRGYNVLFCTGWDSFGLPAEQYAIKTNTPPSLTTRRNTDRFREQTKALGISYDWDREVNTSDPDYYRWTQWIFLQIYNSYFDPVEKAARPISQLVAKLENEEYVVAPDGSVRLNPSAEGMGPIVGEVRIEQKWDELSQEERREVVDGQRLAYADEAPVNWCPGLGTVLSNEEVIDGRSEVGGFAVERRPMRQWMMRITAFADRLIEDLDDLKWPDSIKEMQRNWIGRSEGAEVDFDITPGAGASGISRGEPVFTTRPDTLYGATYLVLAPEHPLVDAITSADQKAAVAKYRAAVASRSERDRMADAKDKTGVFTGASAINPVNKRAIPVYVADYVLMGYGTGAIMAVPAHDQRDYEFAKKFSLPMRTVVRPVSGNAPADRAFEEVGIAVNSGPLDGLETSAAKERCIELLEEAELGVRNVRYKLRDWLFARQRYWGEPFPIVLDTDGTAYAIDESELPLTLPGLADFRPTGLPEGPLSKAGDWLKPRNPAKDFAGNVIPAAELTREISTMPQWAGSCWYYLRFCDPKNSERMVDPIKERYWMPVDLYVGGVEHAVLHLLYARFWHKVLFDLGHLSTREPFGRLVNQGLILGEMEYHAFFDGTQAVSLTELRDVAEEATDAGVQMIAYRRSDGRKILGRRVDERQVERRPDGFYQVGTDIRLDARSFKMSKSRGNVVTPDEIIKDYGADVFRLYEMYMGPLEAQKPWNTRDIVGMSRFLASVWRNLMGDEESGKIARIEAIEIPEALDRQMHRTIKKVGADLEALRFNTAIAELIKLNSELTAMAVVPRALAENLTRMLSPFAPHVAEELWERLGHKGGLAREPWPAFDVAKLSDSTIELPVQVNGKVRDKIVVAADADEQAVLTAAEASEKLRPWLEGKKVTKRLYVRQKLVSFVVG